MNQLEDKLQEILKHSIQLAVGCTEPVAIGFLANQLKKHVEFQPKFIRLKLSHSLYKNGKAAFIPGVKESGLDLAAAIGYTRDSVKTGLMVFSDLTDAEIIRAKKMLKECRFIIELSESICDIYAEMTIISGEEKVIGRLEQSHDHISYVEVNGNVLRNKPYNVNKQDDTLKSIDVAYLIDYIEKRSCQDLAFIKDGIEYNIHAAYEGMNGQYGLNIGKKLKTILKNRQINVDSAMEARMLTAAAADMRMGGGECPVMTSGGSGNQGIGVIIPIVTLAKNENIAEERMHRAILLGHLLNELVKIHSGKLSGMCGCAIGSGVGATGAITWMLGGTEKEISCACNYMIANLAGMLCDGAKDTCSLKLSTCAYEAVFAAYLALAGVKLRPSIGIVGKTFDQTIHNTGYLCKEAFTVVDRKLIEII